MSEVQSRPYGSRGRGPHRGGRGGYRGTRNGSRNHTSSNDENISSAEPEEQGEVGELKKTYGDKVTSLRELCGGWSDEDIVYALKETDGDANLAFDRITNGTISQWGEVKKKQPKAKDPTSTTTEVTGGSRGGRGRGTVESRGRGRGGRGGRAGAQPNGTKTTEKVLKAADDGWGDTTVPATVPTTIGGDAPTNGAAGSSAAGDWANDVNAETSALVANEIKADAALSGKVGGWAGLFAKPQPAPKKAVPHISAVKPEETTYTAAMEETVPKDGLPPPLEPESTDNGPSELPETPPSETPITLTPSKDELTETNLERIPDISGPPASATAASTVASTQDPLSTMDAKAPAVRPGMSGYAASALKATGGAGRSASFNRRVMEQQEAVVMPGNHAVDRAAVQFGSMGLNGSDEDPDVDEDREEPETRTQMPDDSPAAPRASLPPPSQAQAPAPSQDYSDAQNVPRQAPGLPPVAGQHQQSASPPLLAGHGDQYRYGQGAQKAYDPFGQQPSQSQEAFSGQLPSASQHTPSSVPNDYAAYYGANSREAYQTFYGAGYGQAQESQQRSGSAFGTSSQDAQSQYVTSRPQPGYGQQEAQNSGQNTPNPTLPSHQAQHSQHMPHQQSGYGSYQYGYPNAYSQQYPQYGAAYMNQMGGRYGSNRPMFDDVRRQGQDNEQQQQQQPQGNNQYGYAYNQQYGGNYNKNSMYGQPQHQYSYEHSASPANAGGYGQAAMGGREAIYGRTGSAQPAEAQQTASGNTFGGMPDPFGRSHSGFGSQAQALSQQHNGQQVASEDPAKPSPSMAAANRPGSAVNTVPGQQQQGGQASSFPPPAQTSTQQAFGGYPQYGGVGNHAGHHQGQGAHPQTAAYGGYGSNAAFGQYGGAYGSGRGWTANQYGGAH